MDPDDAGIDLRADADVEAARLSCAVRLDLSFRGLHRLPQGLPGLVSLQELDLRNNQIGVVEESADGGKQEVAGASGAMVAKGAEGLLPRGLRVLRLSTNAIQVLGEHLLVNLDLLQILDLDSNRLGSLPEDLLSCSSLKELHLHRNQLEGLPSSLGERLPLLMHLDVSYNALHSLPDSLGQLPRLEYLSARFNQLERIPAALGRATALKHLDFSGNFVNLTSVPGTLGNLTNLTLLDLSNNQIGALPVQLGRLKSLEVLAVENNPLHFPPLELLTMEVPEAAVGSLSKEEAQRAKARATTEVLRSFLAAKLTEWEEQEMARRSSGTWEGWLGDWSVLGQWLGAIFAAAPPALEGAAVSIAPRASLPAPGTESPGRVQSVALAVTSLSSPARAPPSPETESLVGRKVGSGMEAPRAPTAAPLLPREDLERGREACLA